MKKSTSKSGIRPPLFELPMMVYTQIMMDNSTRKKPFRVSEARIRRTIGTMPEFQ